LGSGNYYCWLELLVAITTTVSAIQVKRSTRKKYKKALRFDNINHT
jgi:hypothetical protein